MNYKTITSSNIFVVFFVLSIFLGKGQEIIDTGKYNISYILFNRSLYDQTLSQHQREALLSYAVWILPQDDHTDYSEYSVLSQAETLLLADFFRKKSIFSRALWEQALHQSSPEEWPSFAIPPDLQLQDGSVYIPFDNKRWKIISASHWKDGQWRGSRETQPKLLRGDLLKVTAENTIGVYELFLISWFGPVARGPYRTLKFEIQPLPDTSFSVVVYQENGEMFQIPIEMGSSNDKWVQVDIPLTNEMISFIYFYVSDKNLENESEFGISIKNGRFSF